MPTSAPRGIRRYGRLLEPKAKQAKPKPKPKPKPRQANTPLAALLRDHGYTMQPILRWMYRLQS